MKTLRCPRCGTYPANVFNDPNGKDVLGFTMVIRRVVCSKCGNRVEGEPGSRAYQDAIAPWWVDLASLPSVFEE